MKGGVVGQLLDINMVCGVLEALGLVNVSQSKMMKSDLGTTRNLFKKVEMHFSLRRHCLH